MLRVELCWKDISVHKSYCLNLQMTYTVYAESILSLSQHRVAVANVILYMCLHFVCQVVWKASMLQTFITVKGIPNFSKVAKKKQSRTKKGKQRKKSKRTARKQQMCWLSSSESELIGGNGLCPWKKARGKSEQVASTDGNGRLFREVSETKWDKLNSNVSIPVSYLHFAPSEKICKHLMAYICW